MNRSNDLIRIALAGASLGTVAGGMPIVSGLFTSSLLLSYLLPNGSDTNEQLDGITELLSLDSFKRNINEAVLKESQSDSGFSMIHVVTFDILGFSEINQSNGYSGGRRALRTVAKTLSQNTKGVFCARPYGDVFAIAYIGHTAESVEKDVSSMISRVRNHSIELGSDIELCAGIALVNLSDDEKIEVDVVSSAITKSEVARLVGKRDLKDVNHYKKEYASQAIEKIRMEDSLLKSIDNGEIHIYYQPKISTATNSIVGFEALSRWIHTELGFVSPAFFIPLAEETGFIHKLGEYVLEESCKTVAELISQGHELISVAVNVSVLQLEHKNGQPLIEQITRMLRIYNLPPSALEIEITESMAAKDFELIKEHVTTLKDMGITVSLDDFGTGESSLYRLKELPLQQLKIDKAFIDDIGTDKGDKVLESIFNLAKAMELETVAEGIEHKAQEDALRKMGCSYLQGYLLGKPMPKPMLESTLAK